mgnify:FL=1
MTRNASTRRRFLIGTSAGLAAVTAGCSSGGGTTTTTSSSGNSNTNSGTTTANTAEVHVMTDYANDAWQSEWENTIKPDFTDNYKPPLNLEFVGLQGESRNRLNTLLQSGNPPELFSSTITEVGDLVARGQTASVTDIVDEFASNNGDVLARSTIDVAGDTHKVPHGLYLGGTLNYRQDVYDALGLSVPKTWDELVENAKAIDEAGGDLEKVRGFAVSAKDSGKAGSDFTNFLYNAAGNFYRYTNEDETEVEIDFPEEKVKASLRTMKELAKYSPDPSGLSWASTIQNWVVGRVGQCLMNNAWLCGVAYANDIPSVAKATNQALFPKREQSLDPIDRGWALIDGWTFLSGADNPTGAKNLMRTMYGSPSKTAKRNLIEPMRFLPAYENVIETDAYQSAEIFQAEDGIFLEKNRHCIENIAPELGGDRPSTPASLYAGRFPIDSEMVNAYIVLDEDLDTVYQNARQKLKTRLEEGQNL